MIDVDHLDPYLLQPVGIVRSKLKRLEDCPLQGPAFADGLDGITPGCEVVLLTWFHKARRNVLKLHPRDNPKNPLRGVFTTRSSNRPNPVGLHRVEVLEVDMEGRLRVRPLEALNGTPIIDIKPILRKSLDV
jgi:tRNA-Thr(GGU) m(6)t(6)A37 methyltransferase TsaA